MESWYRSPRWRRLRASLLALGIIVILVLCSVVSYPLGVTESIGMGLYRNTSPPAASTVAGVTIGLAHSRYLSVETLTLSLTNHTSAPMYLPTTEGGDTPPSSTYLRASPDGLSCLTLETDILSAHGWQAIGQGCRWWVWSCPHDANLGLPRAQALVIAPGETAKFTLYDPQEAYPLWSPGAYRFRIPSSQTPFQAPAKGSWWHYPLVIPHSVTLVTPPVTLTRAWWTPADYHYTGPPCR